MSSEGGSVASRNRICSRSRHLARVYVVHVLHLRAPLSLLLESSQPLRMSIFTAPHFQPHRYRGHHRCRYQSSSAQIALCNILTHARFPWLLWTWLGERRISSQCARRIRRAPNSRLSHGNSFDIEPIILQAYEHHEASEICCGGAFMRN